ncbi:MAG: DUF1460 domain-containing protein [Muribaculum sp.]|nr:DUF1460 domain-containing protein [Muribaculum sp.]
MKLKIALIYLISIVASLPNLAQENDASRSSTDISQTDEISRLMRLPGITHDNPAQNCAIIASALVGAGADDYYYTDSIASLRPNVESFNPMSFINTVIALARAATKSTDPNVADFSTALRESWCRRGIDNGFPSIMWHVSDWASDNIYRNYITEITENYDGSIDRMKSLDYLTRHRDNFAALADSATYAKVRMTEMGFRTHRVPTLKKETIQKKQLLSDLRDGDILVMNPQEDGIDYRYIGFIVNREDGPHFIHYSPEQKKIVEEKEILPRYFKLKTKIFNGYRIFRLK